MELSAIVPLLGKSERDTELRALLQQAGVHLPLPRIPRSENQVNVELTGTPFEFAFQDASQAFPDEPRYRVGDLYLDTIFIHIPRSSPQRSITIPRGLSVPISRVEARAIYGPPHWSSPLMKNDRWTFGDINVLLVFSPDERSVRQVGISHVRS